MLLPVSIFEENGTPDIMLGHKFNDHSPLHTNISLEEWKAILWATKDQVKVILHSYLKWESPF